MKPSSSSGSVLFYVLIGVVLFAALSLVVANIMRSGTVNPQSEVQQVNVSEILQYASGLRQAAKTIQQINGYDAAQISFDTPVLAGYGLACPDGSAKCKMFDPAGAGLTYQTPDARWLDGSGGDWLFSGDNEVTGVGTDGAGTSSVDLLAILPWIKKELCLKLNEMLGITNPGGDPPQNTVDIELTTKFTGTYTASDIIDGISGARAGCIEGGVGKTPSAGTYHFFQVLVTR